MPDNNDIYQEPAELKPWQSKLASFLGRLIGRAILTFVDLIDLALKPFLAPWIKSLRDDPNIAPEVKKMADRYLKEGHPALGMIGISLVSGAAGGAASAALMPELELLKQVMSHKKRFQPFDYPFVLSAWLRGVNWGEDVFEDLRRRGWSEARIETFKKLVWLRLDPDIVQRIWLRDKTAHEKLWQDLHDVGWDDERINVYKELAMLLPSAQDLIHMAVREVFTPEIVKKYGQMEDFPPDFARWAEKIGLTEEWAKNYWAAHWGLPSAGQGFEMLHRGVITEDDLKVLLRAQDVMPYWRDKLTQIAYTPFTRVDVRRMYKLGILDKAGVKRAYLDLGFDDKKAEDMTEFTIAYYAQPIQDEADLEDIENSTNRSLTRADVCDGYKRGTLDRDLATTILAALGYNPAEIDFYLDREDLKSTQDLKDAYARNYHDLYVIGLIDDAVVTADLTTLGFTAAEVQQNLQLWYTERIRRTERPSRTDLARFLKNGIITEERWKVEMARLGWSDEYSGWYLQDMKV